MDVRSCHRRRQHHRGQGRERGACVGIASDDSLVAGRLPRAHHRERGVPQPALDRRHHPEYRDEHRNARVLRMRLAAGYADHPRQRGPDRDLCIRGLQRHHVSFDQGWRKDHWGRSLSRLLVADEGDDPGQRDDSRRKCVHVLHRPEEGGCPRRDVRRKTRQGGRQGRGLQ